MYEYECDYDNENECEYSFWMGEWVWYEMYPCEIDMKMNYECDYECEYEVWYIWELKNWLSKTK